MFQLLDPIFGILALVSLIMLTLLLMVLAQSLPDKPTIITKWIYEKLNPYKPSVIFWNGLYWSLFISVGIVWPEISIAISCFGSVMFVAAGFDNLDLKDQSWPASTFVFWIFLGLFFIGMGLYWVYKHTLLKFNNYLDRKDGRL